MTSLTIQSQASQLEQRLIRWLPYIAVLLLLSLYFFAPNAMASDSEDPGAKISGFFDKIIAALKPISIAIVTIAFVFAGYQIAFNQKRITDVAPVLIGAVVIGAAAQLAGWFLA